MNTRKVIAVAMLAIAAGTACEDSEITGVNTNCSNLQGVFDATSFTVTSTAGAATSVNMLSDSTSFDITFASGAFSSSFQGATGQAVRRSGTATNTTSNNVAFSGQSLFTGSAGNAYVCEFNGGTLRLTAPATTFTFAGETTPRAANVNITLTPRRRT